MFKYAVLSVNKVWFVWNFIIFAKCKSVDSLKNWEMIWLCKE